MNPDASPARLRQNLEAALAGLAPGASLVAGARTLLDALGYRSERSGEIGTVAEFLQDFDPDGRRLTDKQRALFDGVRAMGIVFQVTADEIAGATGNLPASFDAGRAESFLFVAVELDPGTILTRARLADTTRAVNRLFAMPVMVLFRYGATLTLAAIHRRAHKRNPERDVLEKVTLVKDIRATRPHRAHLDILADLALVRLAGREGARSFDALHRAWEQALDIETLNRRFYRELFAWFEGALGRCRFPDDGAGPGSRERHAIRLVTRLLFVWFLKEKGLVPERLFSEDFARAALKRHLAEGGDYYRACLQNLFFATLNTAIAKRAFSPATPSGHRDFSRYRYRDLLASPDDFMATLQSVPFVNGGLFDCLDDIQGHRAGGRRIDAFTDNPAQREHLHVPASLFLDPKEGLFPLFRRYKFTVEENTPLDRELALDPELLGRVFENLLAAYNPETRATARKATGSYYTPRHIVDYMVGEALAAALAERAAPSDGDAGFLRERLGYLLDWEDACDDAATLFNEDEADSLVAAIAGLRVLDPAAGSGAFPMGVLQRLTLALRRLDPENRRWEELQKDIAMERASRAFDARDEAARSAELVEIGRIFQTYRDSDYGRKLYLIQNGIFGIDIQPVACQIAKLRVFISLLIEQQASKDSADNYGIRPLPNLETRFVAADTLIGLRAESASLLIDDKVASKRKDIAAVRERYFLITDRREKLRCIEIERNYRDALQTILENERKAWVAARKQHIEDTAKQFPNPDASKEFRKEELRKFATRQREYDHALADARKVAQWNPYDQNARAAWFDPQWMFAIADGFDIVIGNPPYIRGETIPDKARLAPAFAGFYKATADIYTYFFHKGADLLRQDGLLCYIVSNKFMRAAYGAPLRAFLKRRMAPLSILDFGRSGAFDATVRPLVLLARKGAAGETLCAATVRGGAPAADPAAFMARNGFALDPAALPDSGWSLAEPALLQLRRKIEAAGTPLRDYLKEGICYGIKTGLNEAFVIDAATRERLIGEHAASADLIRPWLRGRDVRRWRADWQGLYLIFTRRGTDIARYPAIERHLARYRTDLEPKPRRGAGRGRKPGSYTWFEIQDDIAYHRAFARPKIVYPIIGTRMRALLDRQGYLTNDKCFILPGADACLLALLNSRLLDLYFRLAMPCLDDPFDGGDMEFRAIAMQHTPIAPPPPATAQRLATLAERIQTAKQSNPTADTQPLEQEIDGIVFGLYGLDEDDVAVVEGALNAGR